jgi:hypothetical protein
LRQVKIDLLPFLFQTPKIPTRSVRGLLHNLIMAS